MNLFHTHTYQRKADRFECECGFFVRDSPKEWLVFDTKTESGYVAAVSTEAEALAICKRIPRYDYLHISELEFAVRK